MNTPDSRRARRHATRARAALKSSELEIAISEAELAFRLEPRSETHRLLLSRVLATVAERYSSEGDVKSAVQFYERSVAIGPDRAARHAALARMALRAHNLTLARRAAERAVDLDSGQSSLWVLLARVLEACGDFAGCREAWNKVIALAEFNPVWHISLARACIALNDFQSAFRAMEPISSCPDPHPEWVALSQLIRNRLGATFIEQSHSCASWRKVQLELSELPGDGGRLAREKAYASFFLGFGRSVQIEPGCYFESPHKIVLDDGCRIGEGTRFVGDGSAWIGRRVSIGSNCVIHTSHPKSSFDCSKANISRVNIGDGVVISADTTILPGTKIGAGSFVGEAAVVHGLSYPEGASLAGKPARVFTDRIPGFEYAPEIGIVVPPDGDWGDLARHLVSSLGLPQVEVLREDDNFPATVSSFLAIGPKSFLPSVERPLWRLADRLPSDSRPGILSNYPRTISIPTVIGRAAPTSRFAAEAALFWCLVRLRKSSRSPTLLEAAEWLISLFLMGVQDRRRDGLAETVLEFLVRAEPPTIRDHIRDIASNSELSFRGRLAMMLRVINDSAADQLSPLTAALEAISTGSLSAETIRSLRTRLKMPISTLEIMAIRCALAVAPIAELEQEAEERLANPALWQPDLPFPRISAGRVALLYSPLVVSWHLIRSKRSKLSDDVALPQNIERRMLASDCGNFIGHDPCQRLVASALIHDWLTLHTAPIPTGRQIVLQGDQHHTVLRHVQDAWLEVFRAMLADANRPLIRLHPWPFPHKAAISLRLDFDRPVDISKVENIICIQQEYLRAAAGSWYFLAGDREFGEIQKLLMDYWQEIGVHLCDLSEQVSGLGVTHHSAPNSSYWQGDLTLQHLEASGANYAEFLSGQVGIPRPAWVAREDSSQAAVGHMWITPIFFPLEGSTSDTTLEYFDKLHKEFRTLIAEGGLVIIGTHPDIDHDLLVSLFRREDLSSLWPTTIARAIDRCREIMGYGQIRMVKSADPDSIALVSLHHASDVAISIYWPKSSKPESKIAQLSGRRPCVIARQPIGSPTCSR